MIENPLGKVVGVCPLCGEKAEVFTLHGVPITSCSCVDKRTAMVAVSAPRLGDFSGERALYTTMMSDTPLGQRSEHVVSVVEARGHAPVKPTISDADRRKRARLAFDRAKGTAPATETWTCDACGSSNISPGCKTCEALAVPVVRSGVDPTERLVNLGGPLLVLRGDKTFVDGMDLDLIQRRFALRGREDLITREDGTLATGNATLTPDQEQSARNLWAMELWKRRLESEHKERHRVVLDVEWD